MFNPGKPRNGTFILNFDLAYVRQQRPLGTLWASALLIVGGVLFAIPIVFTFLANAATSSSIDPELLAPLIVTAVAGAVQLAAAWGAWRGDRWPRRILIALLAAEAAGLLLGYEFVFLGVILTGTATFLLWRSGARKYSTNVLDTRRRP